MSAALYGILFVLMVAFVIGRLGAIAVPGPDPMPAWLSIAIGGVAALFGGGLGYAAGGELGFLIGATLGAAVLIAVYRWLIQKRPLTGPEAWRYPTRGFGIEKIRTRMGIDPSGAADADRQLAYLDELAAVGVLTREELEAKRELVRGGVQGASGSSGA